MVRPLPKQKIPQGFTLIELLVVITIVTVLITIAITTSANSQKQARDVKRRTDIDAIAKSLEATRDFEAQEYANKIADDFDNSVPVDPIGPIHGAWEAYCIKTSTTIGTITSPDTWNSGGAACPQSADSADPNYGWNIVDLTAFTGVKSWKICAKMESNNQIYCKHSIGK